jgi:hypothetical protein
VCSSRVEWLVSKPSICWDEIELLALIAFPLRIALAAACCKAFTVEAAICVGGAGTQRGRERSMADPKRQPKDEHSFHYVHTGEL